MIYFAILFAAVWRSPLDHDSQLCCHIVCDTGHCHTTGRSGLGQESVGVSRAFPLLYEIIQMMLNRGEKGSVDQDRESLEYIEEAGHNGHLYGVYAAHPREEQGSPRGQDSANSIH